MDLETSDPKNGSGQTQNLALTGLIVPRSLDSGLLWDLNISGEKLLSGQGVILKPSQVLGSYVCPTVGAYEPTGHFLDIVCHSLKVAAGVARN